MTTRKTTKRARTAKKETPAKLLKESANKIWLAGLGAFALAEEEGGKLFQTLVHKGKEFEHVGREQFEKAREQVEKLAETARERLESATGDVRERAGDTWQRVEHRWDERTARTLQRLGVPSRDEIARLTKRIEHLTALVEKKAAARRPAARKTASTRVAHSKAS
ncbi:MAG TPA: phasin family protein [Thermoanaerobaculia bacterium]|nr:phasin family protein [Thermoanaerobaculia bacterium]